MGRACAEPVERGIVLLHRIALMIAEAVSRVKGVERAHHGVALDFR
jgi:hypothetical protein